MATPPPYQFSIYRQRSAALEITAEVVDAIEVKDVARLTTSAQMSRGTGDAYLPIPTAPLLRALHHVSFISLIYR